MNRKSSTKQQNMKQKMKSINQLLFNVVLIYTIISDYYNYNHQPNTSSPSNKIDNLDFLITTKQRYIEGTPLSLSSSSIEESKSLIHSQKNFGSIFLFVGAIECETDNDCGANGDKICHENKCICGRQKPIESAGSCLEYQVMDEPCQVDGQCLGNTRCIEGICSCGPEAISQYNPSSKIFYCHPRRKLNEECTNDIQCPQNAYCSSNSVGCLCQNGYYASLVKLSPEEPETTACLPVTCTKESDCRHPDLFQCEDNKCKCLATHFDPTNAKCYLFGASGGGDPASNSKLLITNNQTASSNNNNNYDIGNPEIRTESDLRSILTDLMQGRRPDLLWALLIILISLLLFIFVLILLLSKRGHHLRACFCFLCLAASTKHKQQWDPTDDKAAPPDGAAFLHDGTNNLGGKKRNNSINQKSFRRKKNLDSEEASGDEADQLRDTSLLANHNKQAPSNGDLLHSIIISSDNNRRTANWGDPVDERTCGANTNCKKLNSPHSKMMTIV